MPVNVTTRPVLIGTAATIAGLCLAAALTPDQSPALPIQISVVLGALAVWVGWRSTRRALVTIAVFATLLTALTVHILVGDLDVDKGARELVPDILVLVGAASTAFTAGRRGLRRTPSTA